MTADLVSTSDEDPGEGRESLGTGGFWSTCMASLFSWELRGSAASLLGTGVMVGGRFAKDSALDFVVVSLRHEKAALLSLEAADADGVDLEVGEAPFVPACAAALEKKPRMLCCFPVDEAGPLLPMPLMLFLAVEGVFAGVRPGALDFSPIFTGCSSIAC